MKNKITKKEKTRFIKGCMFNFDDNGIHDFVNLTIDEHEEEELNMKVAMHILIDYFLLENPDITELRDTNMEDFYNYIFGDYWEKEKEGPVYVSIKNGVNVNYIKH